VALLMQPGDQRVAGVAMREEDDLVRNRREPCGLVFGPIVQRDDDLCRERPEEPQNGRETIRAAACHHAHGEGEPQWSRGISRTLGCFDGRSLLHPRSSLRLRIVET